MNTKHLAKNKTILAHIARVAGIMTMMLAIAGFLPGLTNGNAPTVGQPGTVFRYEETFGETGVPYFADTDHLSYPEGVAVDAVGNLWVAETVGGRALQYSGDGTFMMAIGTAGSTSIVEETHLGEPSDIAVDGDGNIWVADRAFQRVVKYDPGGSYLTQVGVSDQSGSGNEHFAYPTGVALDSAGRIYVSDSENHRIQVFDASGVYSATIGVTGEPGTDNFHFQNPYRLAVDADDRLYVADFLNHRVQIFDAGHNYMATLGITGECGDASDNGRLCGPRGVAVDASTIYVADTGNNRVQIFDRTTLNYQMTLGSGGSGDYEFSDPGDVVVDATGNLYVADTVNQRVQKFDSNLTYVGTFGTTGVPYLTDGYHYYLPDDVAMDANGNIGILEEGHGQRFIKLDANGVLQFMVGEPGVWGDDNAHFNNPQAVDFDAQGNIYIADCGNNRIQIFDDQGVYLDTLGTGPGTGNDQFDCPTGVKVDSSGTIYVADGGNHRVQVYRSNHTYVTTIGVTGEAGSDDEHLEWPTAVDVDILGNIYVADVWNFRVQKCSEGVSKYVCTTFAGETGVYGSDFSHLVPMDVAVDGDGRVYVTDQWGGRIQVFDSSGAYLTTMGGDWGPESGRMRLPTGVAVDLQGNVYAADTVNHRIQKFAPGVPDWQQVNINGFGERDATAITALEAFKGQLYAGTTNWEAGGQIYRASDGVTWSAVTQPGFGTYTNTVPAILDLGVFDGQLYAGAGWGVAPGQAWRSPDGASWEPVTTDGFGDGSNIAVSTFIPFNGMLYAGTHNPGSGAQVWRSSSGDVGDWIQVAPDGPGTGDTNQVTGFAVFKDALYAAVEGATPQVWRSPDGSDWEIVVADGFGDASNVGTGGFAEFGGYLYLGTQNNASGAQLWRTSGGTTWQQVIDDGFGNIANQKVEMLVVFAGQLYAEVNNVETGLQILRSSDGTLWEQVNPDGFGDSNNVATLWNSGSAKYQGYLYLGTFNSANGGEIWRYDLQEQTVYLPVIQR